MREDPVNRLSDALSARIWAPDLQTLTGARRHALHALRLLLVMARDLAAGGLNLRAMSLVYTTLLSMVPLLALSFSVLKGFGVHNQLEPALHRILEPLGPKGLELGNQILGFVSRMDVSVLGGLGLAMLIYTVLGLLHKVESAFNEAWHVLRTRAFGQRFTNYLSVVLVGPVLVFGALAITASVSNHQLVQWLLQHEPFGSLLVESSRLLPLLMISAAFTFLYLFVPNTHVDWRAAAAGGIVAGVAWQVTGWGFAAFIASSTQYAAIYSGFAILILLLIWVYLSWLILLIGVQIAFYLQHPRHLTAQPEALDPGLRERERLALSVMALIATQHHAHTKAWTTASLGETLELASSPVERMVGLLVAEDYLAETGDDPPRLVLARETSTITLNELLDKVRASGGSLPARHMHVEPLERVDRLVAQLESARHSALSGMSLKDLL